MFCELKLPIVVTWPLALSLVSISYAWVALSFTAGNYVHCNYQDSSSSCKMYLTIDRIANHSLTDIQTII